MFVERDAETTIIERKLLSSNELEALGRSKNDLLNSYFECTKVKRELFEIFREQRVNLQNEACTQVREYGGASANYYILPTF